MRIKAYILFLPFLIFLVETASFIPAMSEACAIAVKKTSCTKTPEPGKCGNTKEEGSCTKPREPGKCEDKKEKTSCTKALQADQGQDKKTGENSCENNSDCTTCPVCYSFLFQPQYEWPSAAFAFNKNYSSLNASYIYSYTSNVWKPPNGSIYYS